MVEVWWLRCVCVGFLYEVEYDCVFGGVVCWVVFFEVFLSYFLVELFLGEVELLVSGGGGEEGSVLV